MSQNHCNSNNNSVCGVTLDLDDFDFAGAEPTLVYLDKVFALEKDTSCPIIFSLNTAQCPDTFTVTYESADRDCDPCPLRPDAVFKIKKTTAILDFIETCPPGNIEPDQVLINGEEVDGVTFENGRYLVDISTVISQVLQSGCEARNLPTKVFFLIRNVCCFQIRATFILEGTVNTGGRTCCFRAVFSNAQDGPPIILPNGCCTSFAISKLAVPGVSNGNVPTISFRFTGKIRLVNPELKVICNGNGNGPGSTAFGAEGPDGCCNRDDFFRPGNLNCFLALCSKVVVEPTVNVETVRRTLFQIEANEGVPESNENLAALAGVSDLNCRGGLPEACRNEVGGVEDICEDHDEVGGVEDRGRCDCPDVFGSNSNRRNRSAFQFSGNNGCSW